MKKKLELNKETLRDLNDAELTEAVGGIITSKCPETTGLNSQTFMCPSGATWFSGCS